MKQVFLAIAIFSASFLSSGLKAQDMAFGNEFKVTKRSKLDYCKDSERGWRFETGKVETENNETVIVVFFAETKDGQWLKRNLRSDKNGDVKIAVEGCEYTGRYMYYAYHAGDTMYKHPTIHELLAVNGY
jgi:hypothetical protein